MMDITYFCLESLHIRKWRICLMLIHRTFCHSPFGWCTEMTDSPHGKTSYFQSGNDVFAFLRRYSDLTSGKDKFDSYLNSRIFQDIMLKKLYSTLIRSTHVKWPMIRKTLRVVFLSTSVFMLLCIITNGDGFTKTVSTLKWMTRIGKTIMQNLPDVCNK